MHGHSHWATLLPVEKCWKFRKKYFSFCSLSVPLIKPPYVLNVLTVTARFKRARLNRKFRSSKNAATQMFKEWPRNIQHELAKNRNILDLNFHNLIVALRTVRRYFRRYCSKVTHQKWWTLNTQAWLWFLNWFKNILPYILVYLIYLFSFLIILKNPIGWPKIRNNPIFLFQNFSLLPMKNSTRI